MSRECMNGFCIYQKNNKCMLDEISVDAGGVCAEMIYVNIAESILEELKFIDRKNLNEDLED